MASELPRYRLCRLDNGEAEDKRIEIALDAVVSAARRVYRRGVAAGEVNGIDRHAG